jgi:hypothetical protein
MLKDINDSILFGKSISNNVDNVNQQQTTLTLKNVEDTIDKLIDVYNKMPPTHTFSSFVYKNKIVNRTWKERLFTLPWEPWLKTKIIKEPAIYETPYGIVAHTSFKPVLEKEHNEL